MWGPGREGRFLSRALLLVRLWGQEASGCVTPARTEEAGL